MRPFLIQGRPFSLPGCCAGRSVTKARKLRRDILDNPVCEIFLFGIGGHVGEGRHNQRRRIRRCPFRRDRVDAIDLDPPDIDRIGHVLDGLQPQRGERRVDLAAQLFMDGARDADAARRREAFHARGRVHPVAQNVVAIDDHIAEVDPDPKPKPVVFVLIGFPVDHGSLNRQRCLHGGHGGGEIDQQPVAHRLD